MQNKFFKDKNLPYLETRYTLNSNKEYKEHFHTTFSVGAIIDGKAKFINNKKNLTLTPNMLVVLNPLELHSCNPIKSSFRSYYMLYIDTNYAYNLQQSIFKNINKFLPISQTLIQSKQKYKKFIELNRLLLDNNILYLQKQEALEEFLILLFKKYCNNNFFFNLEDNRHLEKINQAKKYIEKNYYKNLTIEEIAKSINISPFYFSRIFKSYTNISPYQYLLNIRVEKAKEFLKNSSNSISIIAYELGFSDQSHFNRVFKALTTLTPYEYKIS
jgi:AraC-like DNA-binding protein